MQTTPPDRLATALADRYRIERELGAGGMATVYLAHDVKHDRKVALKVLRPELAAVIGAERFLAEIKTTANLQHPHILALFDSGQVDGTVFYVMPYVEGESLRDRLEREKQLPIDSAIQIAKEVAGALQYAHEHGVVHRDIKPENILLHGGHALVADFGIALAASTTGGARMTETGMSLGTPHYMSPEQAMGERTLDARTDIYALGCVTYEMLLGEPPFSGPTAQAIVAKVMTEKPADLIARRDRIPPAVEDAVLTALEKLPADRFATAAEFANALEGMQTRSMATRAFRAAPARTSRVTQVVAICSTVAALVLGALLVRTGRAPAGPVTRLTLDLPDLRVNHQLYTGSAFALSPDGSQIAYVAQPLGAPSRLMVRSRGDFQAREISGTEGADGPFFSPDGKWIGYSSGQKLYKVPVSGGTPVLLSDAVSDVLASGAWLSDGRIVFSDRRYWLVSVPVDGGPSTDLLEPGSRVNALGFPSALPRNDAILTTICNNNCTQMALVAVDLGTKAVDTLMPGGSRAWYLADGRLAVVRQDGSVVAGEFDLATLKFKRQPTLVLTGVQLELGIIPEMSVANDGTLIYLPADQQGSTATVARVDRAGRATPVDPEWSDRFSSMALSPDGTRLAVSTVDRGENILWVKQLDHGPLTRLSFQGDLNYRAAWHPGGRILTYVSDYEQARSYAYDLRADGSGKPVPLFPADTAQIDEVEWSRDGQWVVYRTGVSAGFRDIYARAATGDTSRITVAAGAYDEYMPALSPDGKWIAYVSEESGRQEVYVRPFPDTDRARWQVSAGGGSSPAWAPSGKELYYVTLVDSLVVAAVVPGTEFRVASRQALFSTGPFTLLPFHRAFEVSPDGTSFLFFMRTRAIGSEANRLNVVLNWFEELETTEKAAR